MNQRYQQFVPKADNVGQTVSAADVNTLQNAIDELQKVSFAHDDQLFIDEALVTMMNHVDVNSAIIDVHETDARINTVRSIGIRYHAPSRAVYFDQYQMQQSVLYTNPLRTPTNKAMDKLLLIVSNMEHSSLATLTYEYSYDGGVTFYPIVPNQSIPTATAKEKLTGEVILRFTVNRMDTKEVVRLDAWALLYQDSTYLVRFLDNGLGATTGDGWDGTILP